VEHLLAPPQRDLPDLDGALDDDEETVAGLPLLEEGGVEAEPSSGASSREPV
jgi:hypothetical protein